MGRAVKVKERPQMRQIELGKAQFVCRTVLNDARAQCRMQKSLL